ncbi:MAG: leucine-rich repeat protein [Oscillospiraceae bacterium]|nr:leucine-rich repeat protein [Oscillospiraceae bacterium]
MNIKSADERLKEYQPLWENWVIDSTIHNGVNSRVYKIKRNRDGEDEFSVMKVVTITLESDMLMSKSDGMKYLDDRCARAKAEIRSMIKLQRSPYIVSYFDDTVKTIYDENGEKAGYDLLIRMEYLECFGAKIRESEHSMTTGDIINLAYDIGYALRDIHKCNMIHRDIKPDNIFIDEYGYYKLGDFGVTKTVNATGYTSTRTGTEPYAAPEVWVNDERLRGAYAFKADIYSFGIVLYQLINGNLLPFMTDFTHNELERSVSLRMRGEKVPPPTGGNPELRRIVCRMCEYSPDNRYRDMNEFLKDLEKAGERSEYGDADINEYNGSISQDLIPTLDANEGFEYDDIVEEIPAPDGMMPGVAPARPLPESSTEKSVGTVAEESESAKVPEESAETVTEENESAEVPEESAETVAEENEVAEVPEELVEAVAEESESVEVPEESVETVAEESESVEVPKVTEVLKNVTAGDTVFGNTAVVNQNEITTGNNVSISPSTSQNVLMSNDEFQTISPDYSKNAVHDEWNTHMPQLKPEIVTQEKAEKPIKRQTENRVLVIPDDKTFKNRDYRVVKVRNGVLNIPHGYSKVDFFTIYNIERVLIRHIIVPETVTQIDEGAFRELRNLESIDFNANIMIVKRQLFSGCTSLKSIVIPASVKRIEDFAFEECKSLKYIEICGNISGLGKSAFTGFYGVVKCVENSFVHNYCQKYNIKTEFI